MTKGEGFLLETSVLRTLTGPLCDAVTGGEGSVRVLRELACSNLFVVALDEEGGWYRYHHLFSEFCSRVRSTGPKVSTLRQRASVWLEGEGLRRGGGPAGDRGRGPRTRGHFHRAHWYGYYVVGQTAAWNGG